MVKVDSSGGGFHEALSKVHGLDAPGLARFSRKGKHDDDIDHLGLNEVHSELSSSIANTLSKGAGYIRSEMKSQLFTLQLACFSSKPAIGE